MKTKENRSHIMTNYQLFCIVFEMLAFL